MKFETIPTLELILFLIAGAVWLGGFIVMSNKARKLAKHINYPEGTISLMQAISRHLAGLGSNDLPLNDERSKQLYRELKNAMLTSPLVFFCVVFIQLAIGFFVPAQ